MESLMQSCVITIGQGYVWLDVLATLGMWAATGVSIYVSMRFGKTESQRSLRARWVLGMGFLLIALTLTVRMIQLHDLPISLTVVLGYLLLAAGYIELGIDRVRSQQGRAP